MTETHQLIREYVDRGSESAFGELVSRYTDLVYSVALRRMNRDVHLAEDVAQTVFTDLARKARSLPRNVMLGGWLHRHTCFIASSVRRGDIRRQAREKNALEMNTLISDSEWNQLGPVLDEAIDELDRSDQEAIVLRFFERQPLRAIGQTLGASEDAVQKRVSRALEKLRMLLQQKGVTLGLGAISAALAERAVNAAPPALAERLGHAALENVSPHAGLATGLAALLTPALLKTGLIGASAAALLLLASWKSGLLFGPARAPGPIPTAAPSKAARAGAREAKGPVAPAAFVAAQAAATDAEENTNVLRLVIVAAESDKPIPNVPVDYRGWHGRTFVGKKLTASREGVCRVPLTTELTELSLTTRVDDFADTQLLWRPDRGDKIPLTYRLRLVRPAAIAGRVLDPMGQPVEKAKVGFNHEEDPASVRLPESHQFSWIEVETDSNGGWRINRIAPEMIRRLHGGASHPDFANSEHRFVSQKPGMETELLEGRFVFRLGKALTVSGLVVDEQDQAVSPAIVRVGNVGTSGSRVVTNSIDGTFLINGCEPGETLLSAEAKGFAATTIAINVSADSEPYKLVLRPGMTLILRVVNKQGQPVANANVWLNTFGNEPIKADPAQTVPIQVEFSPKTDQEGRVIWDSAPDADLTFDIQGAGYMRVSEFKVHPNGQEHIVTLPPALTISGTVRDAETGEAVPTFRIVTGWPHFDPIRNKDSGHWSPLERFWLTFKDGKFQHRFEEYVLHRAMDPSYIFKFEAEGYAPFVSRTVRADEGAARFDVTLRKAKETTLTVQNPDGSAAANTDVGLVYPGAALRLSPNGFASVGGANAAAIRHTDSQGILVLQPDDAVQKLLAANRFGYGERLAADLPGDVVIRLQKWGRVDGTVLSGGKPAVGRAYSLGFPVADAGSVMFDISSFRVESDGQGKFSFPKAPPGSFKLVELITMKMGAQTSWTHRPVADLEIRPGETTTISLGGNSYGVKGRIRLPGGFKLKPDSHIMAMLQTPYPKPPPEIANDQAAMIQWYQTPGMKEIMAKVRNYEFSQGENGEITVDDIPPGEYTAMVAVMDRVPIGAAATPEGLMAQVPVIVPSEPGPGTIDLGEIELKKWIGSPVARQ